MGKAFTTAVRWLAPLGAMLAPRRLNPATLNDAKLGPQAPKPASKRAELAHGTPKAGQDLVGIALQPESPSATLEARTEQAPAVATHQAHAAPAPSMRPLRVLRIRENGPHPRQAGRLVISGRMADVCAELERLAAAHPGLVH